MDLAVLAAVFVTTNIWGLYSAIPFTAIQPSRSFLDRAVGSFQLTSTLHTVGHIRPYLLPKATKGEPMCAMDRGDENTMQEAMADFIHSRDSIMSPVLTTATRIDNTSFATSLPILMATDQHLPKRHPSKPETTETAHNTLVLAILIGILSILINDIMRRTSTTREIRLLRDEVHILTTELEDYSGTATHECLKRLAQIREGMNQLFTLGKGLLALPDRLDTAITPTVASTVAEQLNNPTSDMARHLREIQDDLQQLQDSVAQNMTSWRELAELLRELPSAVSSAIASSVAAEIAGSKSVSAMETSATHDADLRHSIWADKTLA